MTARQLLFFFTIAACSTYGFGGAAQDLAGEGTSIDVVERIPPTVVANQQGGRQLVFSVKFLCGRVDARSEGLLGGDLDRGVPGGGRIGVRIGDGDDRAAIGIGDRGIDSFGTLRLDRVLAPGIYRTVITVFNPNTSALRPSLRVIATPPVRAGGLGEPLRTANADLGSRRAFELDCVDILDLLGDSIGFDDLDLLDTDFLGGLIVLETADRALDVSAVYTARAVD